MHAVDSTGSVVQCMRSHCDNRRLLTRGTTHAVRNNQLRSGAPSSRQLLSFLCPEAKVLLLHEAVERKQLLTRHVVNMNWRHCAIIHLEHGLKQEAPFASAAVPAYMTLGCAQTTRSRQAMQLTMLP
jgi:hypothetical protein